MGQLDGFEAMLIECRPWAVRLAIGLCDNRDLAEDIVQEASMLAWGGFSDWEHRASFQNWLGTIIKNLYLDMCKKRRVKVISLEVLLESEYGDGA